MKESAHKKFIDEDKRMLTSKVLLVEFRLLDPDEEPLVDWLQTIGFWDIEIEFRIQAAKLHLPLDLETRFREEFNLPLKEPTKTLFGTLLQKENGIPLETLGHTYRTWRDPETCTGKLAKLGVVRLQDKVLLKPINAVAFDPRVQYLIGTRPLPIQ